MRVHRFACTQCGECCDRSPEVELSEAAPLASDFIFHLMFRLYSWPTLLNRGSGSSKGQTTNTSFYEQKRLLTTFSAARFKTKVAQGSKAVEHTQYLTISALALSTRSGNARGVSGISWTLIDR